MRISTRGIRAHRIASTLLIGLVVGACAGGASSASSAPGDVGMGLSDGGGHAGAPAASAAPSAAAAPGRVGAVDDARIVRTGTMELEVSDVPRALTAARDAIRGLGGYVGASETTNDGDQPRATITYRIPVDRWEEALQLLRGLGGLTTKVVAERTEAVEVTGQIVDLEARIRNLRASETALQAIAAKAVRISDVLEVQAQLTAVRGQIEQLTAQLTELGNRADLATLTVNFGMPIVAVEVAQKGWEPTVVVDEATASLVSILQALATAGIWFAIVWLPILLVLGVMAAITAFVVRRLGFGRRPVDPLPPATTA